MSLKKRFNKIASRVAMALMVGSPLAACTSTQVMPNGVKLVNTHTPISSGVRARSDTSAMHQSQIEILCQSENEDLRKIGQYAAAQSTGEAGFRMRREQDLAAAREAAGVKQAPKVTSVGACSIP